MTPRTAFLRALPRHGFVPPAADVPADLPGDDAAARSAALVAAFAAEFWSIPAAERVARWGHLKATAVGPAAARLAELRAGADVVPAVQADADAAELVALVKELVTLPPRARAARRFEWLTARAAGFPRWAAAARVVLHADPPLARLEPWLFDWLTRGAAPQRIEYQTWVEARNRWRARQRRRRRFQSPPVWVVVLLLFGLSLAAKAVLPRSDPPARGWSPARDAPRFTDSQIQVFLQYERGGWIKSEPYGYSDWVRAGRPTVGGNP